VLSDGRPEALRRLRTTVAPLVCPDASYISVLKVKGLRIPEVDSFLALAHALVQDFQVDRNSVQAAKDWLDDENFKKSLSQRLRYASLPGSKAITQSRKGALHSLLEKPQRDERRLFVRPSEEQWGGVVESLLGEQLTEDPPEIMFAGSCGLGPEQILSTEGVQHLVREASREWWSVPADGDCGFHALAAEGVGRDATEVRRALAAAVEGSREAATSLIGRNQETVMEDDLVAIRGQHSESRRNWLSTQWLGMVAWSWERQILLFRTGGENDEHVIPHGFVASTGEDFNFSRRDGDLNREKVQEWLEDESTVCLFPQIVITCNQIKLDAALV